MIETYRSVLGENEGNKRIAESKSVKKVIIIYLDN